MIARKLFIGIVVLAAIVFLYGIFGYHLISVATDCIKQIADQHQTITIDSINN
jgi:hypothetical protein